MDIIPNISVGQFKLNEHRSLCDDFLGICPNEFKRTEDSDEIILAYDEKSIYVTIDTNDQIIEYSFFPPLSVSLNGVQLLGRESESVYSDLLSQGVELEANDVGKECISLGVNLVEVEGTIDSVEVFNAR